jgi:uncharacterized CHY-type Zn-finger protein
MSVQGFCQNSEEGLAWRSLVRYAKSNDHLYEEQYMNCPRCASALTKEQHKKTSLGYRTFRCPACKQTFNERSGTPFNFLEYPTDLVLLVVLWAAAL